MKEENCGNWALKAFEQGIMAEYSLVYPKWRVTEPEGDEIPVPKGLPFEYFFDVPEIEYIDVVFICRSGSWTPTWCDAAWFKFIEYFKREQPMLWATKQFSELALKKRSPNMPEAKVLYTEQLDVYKRLGVLPPVAKGSTSRR